jgi:hypothetical protein
MALDREYKGKISEHAAFNFLMDVHQERGTLPGKGKRRN